MKSAPDSRLLENLLKAEKTAQESFKQWTKDASAASVALSAWAVADSGETPDLMETSMRIGTLLGTCAESQRTYLDALTSYRASLKDVLMRESDIRTILRDREILVSRLVTLTKKKPSESGRDLHAARLEEAKRELGACEATLKAEEFGLMGVKRRVLRDAFGMRMRSLGELGVVLEESAKAAIELLDQLGIDPRPQEGQPAYDDFRANIASIMAQQENASDMTSPDESIAPSQSASQVARRVAGYATSQSDSEEYDVPVPAPHALHDGMSDAVFPTATISKRTSNQAMNRSKKPPTPPIEESEGSSDDEPANVVAHKGGGAKIGKPSKSSKKSQPRPPPSESDAGSEETARQRPTSKNSNGSGSGFMSGFFGLFKNRPERQRQRKGSMDSADRSNVSSTVRWNTRTESNLKDARKSQRGSTMGPSKPRKQKEDSSDDERPNPKSLVRVVNTGGPPLWRDTGIAPVQQPSGKRPRRASTSIAAEIYNPPLAVPRTRAMSDIGAPTQPKSIMRKPKADESGATTPAGGLSRSGTVTSTTTTGTVKKKKKRVVSASPAAADGTTQPGQKVMTNPDSRYSTGTWVAKPAAKGQQQSLMSLLAAPPSPGLADQSTSRKYGEGATATDGSSTPKKLKKKRSAAAPKAAEPTPASPSLPPSAPQNTMVLPTAPPRVSAADFEPKMPVLTLPTAPPRVSAADLAPAPLANGGPPALTNGSTSSLAPPVPGAMSPPVSDLARRKSVRIAEDGSSLALPQGIHTPSRPTSPAPILRSPSPVPSPAKVMADDAAASKWDTRAGQTLDDSSDEDDQGAQSMSAYHKARRAMNKSGQAVGELTGGRPLSDVAKGKQRATE